DCQGYVGLIANGEFEEALELMMEKIPLPASLGRVCPHPCEDECRRKLIDEPISIQWIKRFAGDFALMDEDRVPFAPDFLTGKRVAVVGGGPMGLSAACFLRKMGHEVTIFEAMPRAGGMLRYGIPEYRLPNDVLDEEIAFIESMGVDLITNTRIGVDIPFKSIQDDFDAVLVGIGAWVSTGVGCKGEDAEGVIGGIDFLRKVVRNEPLDIGENVAIVGGGNTAMDACRTAVRLGAKKVYNVYRRTKDEMPADMIEIVEADEEGVIFKNLTNPIEIKKDKDGKVKQMVLQVMKLGEADESGRRRPIPVKGKTETIVLDTVILAIGQAVDAGDIKGVKKTKRGGIEYNPDTFMTNIPGVFAAGDCGNDKISIAVEAIADAKKASITIDGYLNGEEVKYQPDYVVERKDITERDFEDREKLCRPEMTFLEAKERKDNFTEVIPVGYSDEEAMSECDRCLECGCHDFFECKLIELANEYDVAPSRFEGDINPVEFEDDHPFIVRDPKKCILCGLCVRACDEIMGVGALGLVDRGFDTIVKPNLEKPLAESGCVSCGQCVSLCPTGALQERQTVLKEVPVDSYITDTTCSYCSVGCSFELESMGEMLIKANPAKDGAVNAGLACGKGKFGFDASVIDEKMSDPLIKDGKKFRETDYHEAMVLIAKKAQTVAAKYGKDAVAVAISDRYTNEEAYAIKKMAEVMEAKTLCFNNRASGINEVLGLDASPNTFDELLSTEVILAVGFNTNDSPVAMLKMKQAAEAGAKVILVNPVGFEQHFAFAHKILYTKNDISILNQIAKALIEQGKGDKVPGLAAFKKALPTTKVTKDAEEIAEIYGSAKKAMIVFQQNFASVEAATLLADIALISGHIGAARDGILQIKAKNNSQGLIDLGITAGPEAMEGVKALLVFGEDMPSECTKGLEFLMVSDTHLTATAKKADVFVPGTGFASADGTYTNTERRLQAVEKAIDEDVEFSNWEIAAEIAHVFEKDFDFKDEMDISAEMDDMVPRYKYAETGEILGDVLAPNSPKLVSVAKGKLVDPVETTDALQKNIMGRLPVPAIPTL
ncbi:MAG: FAD-dependent oxidoreductase, partial [Anaerovoracaceae bacterium]